MQRAAINLAESEARVFMILLGRNGIRLLKQLRENYTYTTLKETGGQKKKHSTGKPLLCCAVLCLVGRLFLFAAVGRNSRTECFWLQGGAQSAIDLFFGQGR